MRKSVSLIATLLVSLAAGAQAVPSICFPQGTEEMTLGSFSRDRFEGSRTLITGAYVGPSLVKGKTGALSQNVVFAKNFSIDFAFSGFAHESYTGIGSYGKPDNVSVTPFDGVASIGFAYRAFRGLSVRAGAKLIYSSIAQSSQAFAFAADLDVQYAWKKGLVGVGVSNLGTPVNYGTSSSKLPMYVKAGGYYSPVKGLKLAGEIDYVLEGSSLMATVGARYTIVNIVYLQAGYHYGSVVPSYVPVGLGFTIKGFEIGAGYFIPVSKTTSSFYSAQLSGTIAAQLSYTF